MCPVCLAASGLYIAGGLSAGGVTTFLTTKLLRKRPEPGASTTSSKQKVAMAGGTLVAVVLGKNDPGFAYNGPLAGLVAVCAGSDVMHPAGALVVGCVAGAIFVVLFTLTQNRWKIDDVLGVWPLHGLCGAWGGVACGIFGLPALGGLGGVNLGAQVLGTLIGVAWALAGGFVVYGVLKAFTSLRLTPEEEYEGADQSIHRIGATPEREASW